jgi:hypothetical protein
MQAKVSPLLMGLLIACAPAMRSTATEAVVAERLYFGRNTGDTLGVTDSAWAVFVNDVVSARLPGGFTFWNAEGQWRGADGRPKREPTFVLEVIHPVRAAGMDSAIVGVIAEYKRRFGQEAVLRVVTVGRATF